MGDVPVVTLRPPFIYGPGNPFYREAFFWDRLRDKRPIIVPEDGSRLMQFVYVHDIVRCCLRVLDIPEAVGHAFNICDEHPATQLDAVQAMARAASTQARIHFLPRQKALDAGGNPMGPKLYFAMYYDLPPITMRLGPMREILGVQPTPFDDGLRATYQWWQENNPFPPPGYTFEDSLLAG
jgi:2'-hydroxyisoflavone reductase